MDYDDLFRLLPKVPRKWSTQEVLVWLKYIGYSQLDQYFGSYVVQVVNECVDGSCLEILTDQDLLDIGISSPLQRKKLLQWIQIGLKEFTNYCKIHIKQVQTFHEQVKLEDRVPLNEVQDRILQSRHEYDGGTDEQTVLGVIPIEPLPSPGTRQKQQFIMPKSSSKITEEELVKQVQQSNKKNIFAELQMPQIPKAIISSPQKNMQESEYYLPQFGTPRFDRHKDENQSQEPQTLVQLNVKIKKEGGSQSNKILSKNATIGRNPENDIQINHESISRTHIWVTLKENQFYIQDRGSLIGTFILLEARTQLLQGYIILMGTTEIVIQSLQNVGQQCNLMLATQFGSVQLSLGLNKQKVIGAQTFGDPSMQAEHAALEYTSEGVSVQDLKSSSGTWLRLSKSGVQSQIVPIARRRVIKIAEYFLVLEPQ